MTRAFATSTRPRVVQETCHFVRARAIAEPRVGEASGCDAGARSRDRWHPLAAFTNADAAARGGKDSIDAYIFGDHCRRARARLARGSRGERGSKRGRTAAGGGADPELKQWAEKTLPTLEEHERLAKTTAAKVGAGARTSHGGTTAGAMRTSHAATD